MSLRTRHGIAWLASAAMLAATAAAWRAMSTPALPVKSSNFSLLNREELKPLKLRVERPASSRGAERLVGDGEVETLQPLDWTPSLAPLRPLTEAEEAAAPLTSPRKTQELEEPPAPAFPEPAATLMAPQLAPPALNGPKQGVEGKSPAPEKKPRPQEKRPQEKPKSPPRNEEPSEEKRKPIGATLTAAKPMHRPTLDRDAVSFRAPRSGDCWWRAEVPTPQRESDQPWKVQLEDLLALALEHSDLVKSMRIEPQIQETEIALEAAAFDPAAFVDSKWNDVSDPVGNTLVTGGPRRLNEHDLETKAGIRQRNRLGGKFEAAQEIGFRDSNSVFFQPDNQANTRLVLSYTQPLLRGRGRCYNEGFVVLAQIQTDLARRQLQQQLQDHLLEVAEAYWMLYLERAKLLQQQNALRRTISIQEELESRAELDVVRSQLMRAAGAVAQRRAAVKRAEIGVKNQEAVIWSLTNAPDLANRKKIEILPANAPECRPLPLTVTGSVAEALDRRPEVGIVFEKIRSAQTRLGIAEHELLPSLNLVMETYVRGLEGDYDVGRSLSRQFDSGAPSYSIGLSFLMPYGNAAAKANLQRRQLEMSQLAHELNATLKRVTVEVENALRDIEATLVTLEADRESMEATIAELEYLHDRWRMLPGDDRLASLILDELLTVLDRVVVAESAYAQSQVDHAMAIIRYKRAAGMLLQTEPVAPSGETPSTDEQENAATPVKAAGRPLTTPRR